MELVRCTSVFDESGRFAPVCDESDKISVEADVIVMAVGYSTDLKFAEGVVNTSRVSLWLTMKARQPMYQVSSPVVRFSRGAATVIESIADGKKAAIAIDAYLKKAGSDEAKAAGSFIKIQRRILQ